MPQYIVFALPVGAPAPTPDLPYPTTACIHTAASMSAAVQDVAAIMKVDNTSLLWALDMAAMSQYVVTRSYSASVG